MMVGRHKSRAKLYNLEVENHWDEHLGLSVEDGLCRVCGVRIVSPWDSEQDDYKPPETCPNCGWPDEFDPEG